LRRKRKTAPDSGAVLEFVFDSLSAVGRRMGARERLSRWKNVPHCFRPNTWNQRHRFCHWNRWSRPVRHPNNAVPVASSHCVPQAAELLCASREKRREHAATKRRRDSEFYFARFRCAWLKRRPFVRFRSGIPPLS